MATPRQRTSFLASTVHLVAILVTLTSFRAVAASPGSEFSDAREIKVLLLPPLDLTVDSARLQPLRQKIMRLREQYEFITRHFTVLGESFAVRAATAMPTIDLQHIDARNEKALDDLAGRTGSDWVVSVAVRDIAADPSAEGVFAVHSSLSVRIRDARKHVWLVNGPYTGHLNGSGAPGRLFIDSLDAATGEALAAPLAGYPQVVAVSRDGAIVDYLPGQTAPFTGSASAQVFSGLGSATTGEH